MKKLIIIVPYFGSRPKWFDFYMASCAKNPDMDFLLVTDFPIDHKPTNVIHLQKAFPEYKSFITKKLEINPQWDEPYKLCDLKPALGYLHLDIVRNYQFFGYSDLDLVYGNVLEQYDSLMAENDVISSHTYLMAGHFAVYRTMKETLTLFSRVPAWRKAFSIKNHIHFDEIVMSNLLMPAVNRMEMKFAPQYSFIKTLDAKNLKILFKEQFTTFNRNYLLPNGNLTRPTQWVWNKGELSNDVIDKKLIYAHFSLWNSGKWGDTADVECGAWHKNKQTTFHSLPYDDITCFCISADGFKLGMPSTATA